LTGEWLTYLQAAERLGVSPNAARQRAVRGRWQQTLGNDKRTRVRLPDGWEHSVRAPNGRSSGTGQIPAKLLIAALEAHIGTLKTELTVAEARAERLVAEFAAREARLAADLAIERTLADQMSARVDNLTTELAAQRAMAEKGLNAELARAWWKPRLGRRQ